MAQVKAASLRSQVFARKGLARPASGFRVAAQANEDREDDQWDVGEVPVRAAGQPVDTSGDGEPEPAASLARGGFSAADLDQIALPRAVDTPPQSGAGAHVGTEAPRYSETGPGPAPTDEAHEPAAAPAEGGAAASEPVAAGDADTPDEAAAAGWLGGLIRDLRRDVLVVAGLAVLVAGGLAVGYQIGTVTRGGADKTAAAPAAETQPPTSGAAAEGAEGTSAQADAWASATTPARAPIGDTAPTVAPAAGPVAAEAESVPSDEAAPEDTAAGPAPTPAPKPQSNTAGAPDLYAVQLGSLPTRAGAQQVWDRATAAQGPLFAGLELEVKRAVLDGNPYYRARTGAFSDFDAAEAFCATLRGRGLDCLVVMK